MRKLIRSLRLALLAFAAAGLGSCATNPATGETQLILMSEREEIALGRQGAEAVEQQIGVYDDPDLQSYVEEIGMRMAKASERPNLPWSFKIMDDPVVNAFALPGGPIYVTRGILGNFTSEAELAGVLGHEIGHVTGRHSAEQLSRAQLAQLGLGVGSILSEDVRRFGGLISAGLGIAFLKFGRDDERQADDLGFRYMTGQNYDPRELVEVFRMLGRVTEAAGGRGVPSWLSTHPDPGERVERIRERIAQSATEPDGTVARERYLRHIDGLVFGEDPRHGYFREGGLFLHPDLKFQIRFPTDWRTQNTAQAVLALSPAEDAILQLTLAEGASASAAARSFFGQQGVSASNRGSGRVSGFPASWGYFSVRVEGGVLRGYSVFLEYDRQVFQVMGYTSRSIGAYDDTFRATAGSFDRLTDPAALNVEPRRIRIVEIDRAMTIAEFNERYPSTVELGALAIMNGVDEAERIAAGTTLKRVVGQPPQ